MELQRIGIRGKRYEYKGIRFEGGHRLDKSVKVRLLPKFMLALQKMR